MFIQLRKKEYTKTKKNKRNKNTGQNGKEKEETQCLESDSSSPDADLKDKVPYANFYECGSIEEEIVVES